MKKRFKIIFKPVLIVLLSVLLVLLWNNRKNFSPDNVLGWIHDSVLKIGNGSGFPYQIVGNKINRENFKVVNGNVLSVSDTSFIALNKSAKEIANRQHSFGSPILKYNGSKVLIYNLYGNGYQIESLSKTISRGNTENNIITAAIADNGMCGFITESNGYFCEMNVISEDGKDKIYKYFFSESYMTSMDFSEDGKNVAVVGYSAENGTIKSVLYVFDYSSESPKIKMEFVENALIEVQYLSNGDILVVGDSYLAFINPKSEKESIFSYEDKVLTAFDVNKIDGVVFSLSSSNDGNMCSIQAVNLDRKKLFEIDSKIKISDISYKSGNVMALSYGSVTKYNDKGVKIGEQNVKSDAKAIEMFSANGAYVLGTSEIRKIKF